MLTKNHRIAREMQNEEKKKEKMKLDFPELFSREELQTELDEKNKLKQHSEYLLKYIKTQNKEKMGNRDTKTKLATPLKQLLKK